ncbi:unnamed protein product [Notodromas monacha]|uniref:Prolyl-tRNA synthetase n=1 Tax=Notodromas monacha TaxID=399045 RepID=A0A7R9GEH7_9CRUS|nr:unnamed protein product [Notodromas monacha]CAG0919749.1 unnamed protein product [Notodromas monacha]
MFTRMSRVYAPQMMTHSTARIDVEHSHQLLETFGFVKHCAGAGFYHLLPLGYRVMKKLCNLVDEVMTRRVHAERMEMPSLSPEELWRKTGRLELCKSELFILKDRHDKRLVLNPTHEEAVTWMMKSGERFSHRQLPFRIYQISSKFRDEMKPRYGLMRSREFLMKDLYTFDVDEQSGRDTYFVVKSAYREIFDKLGVMYVEGHAFLLGTRYSEPLGAKFKKADNTEENLFMGCYGLGLSRIMSAVLEGNHKNRPSQKEAILRWPQLIAPFSLVLIPPKAGSAECKMGTEKLLEFVGLSVCKKGMMEEDILIDDRTNLTIGKRLLTAKRWGIPYAIIAGKAAAESVPKLEFVDVVLGTSQLVSAVELKERLLNTFRLSGQRSALERIEELTGKKITFHHVDLLDRNALNELFDKHEIDIVIHFAAMKAISESMKEPLMYYENNIMGTINLLTVMKQHNVRNFVFSGSCTVYGAPQFLPLTEEHPTGNPTNVYGRTKFFCEELLRDVARAEPEWNIISLRYFNPVGAHPSGRIGEDPVRAIANIMPFLGQVAAGTLPVFTVFGNDYDTRDGTCVRDYIHIMDLASGHVAAVKKLEKDHVHFRAFNLGIGKGVTVLELIKAFEKASGAVIPVEFVAKRDFGVDPPALLCSAERAKAELDWNPKFTDLETMFTILELIKQFEESCGVKIPYVLKERREGDVGCAYGNIDRARDELQWKPQKSLDDMCKDFWRWKAMNPNGYKSSPASE